jgi:hypothetical protein
MRASAASTAVLVVAFACARKEAPLPPLPPPSVEGWGPIITVVGKRYSFALAGHHLAASAASSDLPSVTLTRTRDLQGNAASSIPLTAFAGNPDGVARDGAQLLGGTLFAMPDQGVYALTVRTAAGLEVRMDDALVVFPLPGVTKIEPSILCQGHTDITVTGTFIMFDQNPFLAFEYGVSPSGEIVTDRKNPPSFPLTPSGCQSVPYANGDARICSSLQGTVGFTFARTRLEPMLFPYSSAGWAWTTADVPIESGSRSDLVFVGEAVDADLEEQFFAGFMTALGVAPEVLLDGSAVPVVAMDCSPSGIDPYQHCSTVRFTVPQGTAVGEHSIVARFASGCASSGTLRLMPRPEINGVSPSSVCQYGATPVRVQGTGFLHGGGVAALVDGSYVPSIACTPETEGTCLTLQATSWTPGVHQVVIRNYTSPRWLDSAPASFTVTPGPADIGWPAPNLIYSGATTKVFFPLAHVTGTVTSAALRAVTSTGPAVAVEFTPAAGGSWITFPSLGRSDAYALDIVDGSLCAPLQHPTFTALPDPVIASMDFAGPSVLYTRSLDGTEGPPLTTQQTGNPGPSVTASRAAAGSDWYFLYYGGNGPDYGMLRFDLLASGDGDPLDTPGIILFTTAGQIERTVSRPNADTWTHYDVALDSAEGWTFRDSTGSRAATWEDLKRISNIGIRGSWWSGMANASIDNFIVGFAR